MISARRHVVDGCPCRHLVRNAVLPELVRRSGDYSCEESNLCSESR